MSNIYLAAPVFGADETKKEHVQAVYAVLNGGGHCVYRPDWLRIPNAWNMPLEEWARCVFTHDLIALDSADTVVVLDYGRHGTCGTAWETGYAKAKGKEVWLVTADNDIGPYSLMFMTADKMFALDENYDVREIEPQDIEWK